MIWMRATDTPALKQIRSYLSTVRCPVCRTSCDARPDGNDHRWRILDRGALSPIPIHAANARSTRRISRLFDDYLETQSHVESPA